MESISQVQSVAYGITSSPLPSEPPPATFNLQPATRNHLPFPISHLLSSIFFLLSHTSRFANAPHSPHLAPPNSPHPQTSATSHSIQPPQTNPAQKQHPANAAPSPNASAPSAIHPLMSKSSPNIPPPQTN